MPYVFFREYFPDVADRETRSITVLSGSQVGLPAGDYGFLEMYCDERGCDCRRVFFYVVSSFRKKVEAVVAWGWEDQDFYAKWMDDDDPATVATLKGPIHNPGSPRTELAPAIVELVRNVLLQDTKYVDRIKRHYKMFKDRIEGRSKDGPKIIRLPKKL
jgi:hypothetical protein